MTAAHDDTWGDVVFWRRLRDRTMRELRESLGRDLPPQWVAEIDAEILRQGGVDFSTRLLHAVKNTASAAPEPSPNARPTSPSAASETAGETKPTVASAPAAPPAHAAAVPVTGVDASAGGTGAAGTDVGEGRRPRRSNMSKESA